jgi:hypothetical protein
MKTFTQIEERRGLSDRAGNFGYLCLRDTVAAILQKADERSSPTTENLLRAVAILVK